MGEPAGIGGELSLLAWRERDRLQRGAKFFCIDDPARLASIAASLGWQVPLRVITLPEEATICFEEALPVLPLSGPVRAVTGQPAAGTAALVKESIETAVRLSRERQAGGVVTNPLHKAAMYGAGFGFPGHTEFLAELDRTDDTPAPYPVMMLAGPQLRVIPVTIHMPLAEAARTLSTELIVKTVRIAHEALKRDFGIPAPRLVLAGLNPHAGEDGTLGREDIEIIAPAIKALREEGIDASGPWPADTLFHAARRRQYDAAFGMYHDQALIPIKTLDFDRGVNVTLGLSFIRTSPDHGTACDIAGTGKADPTSLLEALRLAHEMATHRSQS
ncbi:4-hydroxythreonine-4-phosphate dehydrogenase PdxA [Radicibacter daui]|uniref:4-hydroxythreonine-4-phosphate dehydrogenase PdxA n=1 Tax=Radicibacter daui TaxID=3064829 RepID=UPI004046C278